MKQRHLLILVLVLLLMLTIPSTLAYWKPTIESNPEALTLGINVGKWKFEETIENFGFIDFFEDIEFINDKHPYQTLIKGKRPSEYEVIVVYYPPTNLYYKLDLNKHPTTCNPYNSNTGCRRPDISDPYNNPYEQLQLEYLRNLRYPPQSDVLYEGDYYTKVDNNQTAPNEAGYPNWLLVNQTYEEGKTYSVYDRIVVDNQLYIANYSGTLSHPHLYTGEWNLKTYDYVEFNTYHYRDVVLYKGKYYYALYDNFKNISPDNSNYWKLAG